ncbi:MAG TPA: hypothetical protein VMG81_02135, partial [Thermoplasmata archaeon]|nr:hypothetical protein [Thermoplasmata archaeon]
MTPWNVPFTPPEVLVRSAASKRSRVAELVTLSVRIAWRAGGAERPAALYADGWLGSEPVLLLGVEGTRSVRTCRALVLETPVSSEEKFPGPEAMDR